jgi:hypothetical protein
MIMQAYIKWRGATIRAYLRAFRLAHLIRRCSLRVVVRNMRVYTRKMRAIRYKNLMRLSWAI